MTLTILYQDEHCIAVDKTAGLLLHRSYVDRYETQFALQIVRDQIGQRVYPVHRLDRPTSGILLFALHQEAARLFSELFQQQQVEKTYHAVVRGFMHQGGLLDYALKEPVDPHSPYAEQEQDKAAQSAQTSYHPLQQLEVMQPVGRYASARYTLLQLNPHTGRRHQLRRHMKHLFHPIIGDTSYGDGKHNQFFRDYFSINRLLLMAKQLDFSHPYSGEKIKIECPYDEDFSRLLEQAPWQPVRDPKHNDAT